MRHRAVAEVVVWGAAVTVEAVDIVEQRSHYSVSFLHQERLKVSAGRQSCRPRMKC